jgi:hypothetical protein
MPLIYYILMHEVWQGTFYVIVLRAYFGTRAQMATFQQHITETKWTTIKREEQKP